MVWFYLIQIKDIINREKGWGIAPVFSFYRKSPECFRILSTQVFVVQNNINQTQLSDDVL
jgi:hypothetical protein